MTPALRTPMGEISVDLRGSDLLVVTPVGYISHSVQATAYAQMEAVLSRTTGPVRLLWDARRVDGFDAGLPMALTRFFLRHMGRFSRSAMVTTHPTIAAVGHAARRLVPPLPYAVCRSLDEAMRFLRAPTADVR